ncbi:hypothetical protein AB8B21_05740 [Tardiphaga sp. 866_E4_N2_1]|uniref:hypothetical protein n=2 Tax=Tardiphaga TaxID=1395974 RepID=UPI003F27EE39
MANPALTIDVDAKTTKYDKAMQAIGDTADKKVAEIEAKFESFDPQLNTESYTKSLTSMVAGFGIAGVAVGAVITLVAGLNKSLADTASIADRVGLSTERFQQLKFGANSLGLGDDEFSRSVDSFATRLQDAKFQANDLTRVFQANGVAIKDSNGQLKDTNSLIVSAVDIIKRAPTIQDALQIGSFLGFSREFSQSLHEAGDNYLKLAAQANAAGAVIDDATIQKAKVFTEEWQKAATIWGSSLKAAVGDVLPLLNDAVNGAVAVINAVKSVYSFISAIKDFAITPNIDTASLNQLNGLLKQYEDIKKTLDAGQPLNPIQLFQGSNIQNADHQITKDAVDDAIQDLNDEIAKRQKDVDPIRVPINRNVSVNPGPKIAADNGRDQFETTIDQLTKRTATINADTAATFQNNAVQQQLRAEFQLLNAIMRDGGEVTQAQINAYEKLRTTMSAQQALTASGIQLTAEHNKKFLETPVAVGAATAAYDMARESLARINSASQQFGSALSTAFSDAIVQGRSLNDVLANLARTLASSAINSSFASIFNAPSSGGLSPAASFFSSIFGTGRNASGTDNWRGGPSWVGENGPEIVNLPRGSQVIPNSAASRGGGGDVTVNLVEDSSRAGQTQKSDDGAGGFDLTVFVDSITAKNAANPGSATSQVLAQRGRLASR